MNAIIQSQKEFLNSTTTSGLKYTPTFLHGVRGEVATERVETTGGCFFVIAPVKKTSGAAEPTDLINEFLGAGLIQESDLSKGRKWVAGAFFQGQPDSLKTLRLKAGYSQAQLAEKISMSQPNICEFEMGKRRPNLETLRKLSEALGVGVDEVLNSIGSIGGKKK